MSTKELTGYPFTKNAIEVPFFELEDYLARFGYPRNELMKQNSFYIPQMTAYEYLMDNIKNFRPTVFGDLPYGTKMLHVLPYFASYGAINCAHLGFNLGLTLQEIPEFNFHDFGYIAAKQKSEILIGVPNWFNLAAKDSRIKKDALKHVKMAISGGDSNNPEGKREEDHFLLSHGAQCIETNGHGMSELCGSGSYTFPGHDQGLSVGIPFPYDKYIILDENKEIVPMGPDGVQGCAWIYSPSATSGCFEGEEFAETKYITAFGLLIPGILYS